MKVTNNIKIEEFALKLLQQDAILSQNAIHKFSGIDRDYQTRNDLIRPEDFIKLICADKTVSEWENEKLFEHAKDEKTLEDYLLSVFKFVTGWTVDWQKSSTIWSIKPTANNSLFLQCLKSRIFFLAKAVLHNKFFFLEFEQPARKATGVIAILSGVAELQWHILDLADKGKRAKKLYVLYQSACRAIKRTMGKKLSNFFPNESLTVTKFINEALSKYPDDFVFSETILKGMKIQTDPG